MAVDIVTADTYFNDEVFHNDEWVNADSASKGRALKNASNILSRHYPKHTAIPDQAVFEQALWLMKISEARKAAEQGVSSYSIDGISVSIANVDRSIAPAVQQIMGRRVGQSHSGRAGYIVSEYPEIQTRNSSDDLGWNR